MRQSVRVPDDRIKKIHTSASSFAASLEKDGLIIPKDLQRSRPHCPLQEVIGAESIEAHIPTLVDAISCRE